MLTKEDVDQWCRDRGYTIHSRSGDGNIRTYSKHFDKFFLSITVDIQRQDMQLQAFPGLFTLSTGNMQLCHPKFEDFFEKRMAQMMSAIENDSPTPIF
jgi:hypothetical protein